MSKKVLIVSASPRKNSNSEALALAFAEGAKAAGHEVDFVSLRGKTVNFCRAATSRRRPPPGISSSTRAIRSWCFTAPMPGPIRASDTSLIRAQRTWRRFWGTAT